MNTAKFYFPRLGKVTMFSDLLYALRDPKSWVYPAWLSLAVKYRTSRAGWLWMLAGPSVFIFIVGPLFVRFSPHDMNVFIPYMATGIVIFSYISAIITGSTSLYRANKNLLLQGKRFYPLVPLIFIAKAFINLIALSLLIAAVLFMYNVSLTSYLICLLPALLLMLLHSLWISIVFGILGAMFHDIGEAMSAIMRVAFIATPIIWMPAGAGERSGAIGAYLTFNPIYHVLEPVRASILGYAASDMSWIVSSIVAVVGLIVASAVYRKYSQRIVMWM